MAKTILIIETETDERNTLEEVSDMAYAMLPFDVDRISVYRGEERADACYDLKHEEKPALAAL